MTEPHERGTGSSVPARLRIVGWILLATALSFLALVLTVRSSLLADVEESANEDVTQEIDEFRTFAEQGLDPETGAPFASAERLVRLHLQRQFPGEGELLVGRPAAPGSPLLVQRSGEESPLVTDPAFVQGLFDAEGVSGIAESPEGTVRWGRVDASVGSADDGASFLVIEDTGNRVEAVGQVTRLLGLVCVGGLLLTAGLAWLVAGQILAPVRLVRRAAARITRADLSQRIEVRGRDDVAALALTFNAMLERLQRSFTAQQRFTELAGQHLRTPLRVLEEEIAGGSPRATEALRRMDLILDDLAVLAEAERPDFVQPVTTDLGRLTDELAAKARVATGRAFEVEAVASGAAVIDPVRVREAVLRLAANAARFAPAGDPVRIGSNRDGTAVRFWVSDQGPGLAVGDAERVFERFARGVDDANPDGANPPESAGPGLGLAVVRAVADAHQGSAYVDSRPGGGATFGLELPLQAAAHGAARAAADVAVESGPDEVRR